jgi:phage terminase small subunit
VKDVVELKSRDQKIAEALDDNADAMETIFNHVSQGGALTELAKMWDIPYWSITAYIAKEKTRGEILNKAMISRSEYYIERVKQLLNELTESNIQDLYDDNGNLLNPKDMPRTLAACVASIEVFEEFEGTGRERHQIGVTKKVKFWDKTKSIELLAKTMGMFVEKRVHEHKFSLEDLVVASHDVKDVTPIDKK